VKLDKPDFVGRTELAWQHERDLASPSGPRLVGLAPMDPSVVPPEASQLVAGSPSGLGSSGGSPPAGCPRRWAARSAWRSWTSRWPPRAPGSPCGCRTAPRRRPWSRAAGRRRPGRRPAADLLGRPGGTLREFPCRHRPARSRSPPRRRGWPAGVGQVRLTDESGLVKLLVRAAVDGPVGTALGTRFGRAPGPPTARSWSARRRGVAGAVPRRRGRCEAGAEAGAKALRARLVGLEELVSVVDVTHGRALPRLTGPRAADLLAKVCAIDLADDVTPDGAALSTSTAKLVTGLVRDDIDGTPSYLCTANARPVSTCATPCWMPAPSSVSTPLVRRFVRWVFRVTWRLPGRRSSSRSRTSRGRWASARTCWRPTAGTC